jgi:hypothetical protein
VTTLTVPAGAVMKNVTVAFKIDLGALRWRIALASLIFRFGAWVLGTSVEIDVAAPSQRERRLNTYDRDGLPLRMSVDAPNHVWEDGARLEISLDGIVQKEVVAFDREEGWVFRNKLRDGEVYVDGGEIARETVTGEVTVRWKDAP